MGQHMLSKPRCHGVGCCDADSFRSFICVTLPPGNKFQVKRLESSAFIISCLGYNRALEQNERGVEFLKLSKVGCSHTSATNTFYP